MENHLTDHFWFYGEQGLGDQINFGTLLFELLEIQKDVCVKVNKKLVDLFTCSFPKIKVFSEEEKNSAKCL